MISLLIASAALAATGLVCAGMVLEDHLRHAYDLYDVFPEEEA
ncbi:hypothetical protein [Streptosporangium sandarakinum]